MATVKGYVEKIKFRNEDNGYSILSVFADGEDYILVGTFPYIGEGDYIEATGREVAHPVYGDQIQVEHYEMKAPEDTASMERYLGSGAIKGVGGALAATVQGGYISHHRGGAGASCGSQGCQREDGDLDLRADGGEEGDARGDDVSSGVWHLNESLSANL